MPFDTERYNKTTCIMFLWQMAKRKKKRKTIIFWLFLVISYMLFMLFQQNTMMVFGLLPIQYGNI